MIKKISLALIVVLLAYLLFWPVPVSPLSWQAPPSKSYQGDFAVNEKLAEFDAIDIDGVHGPEAVTSDQSGTIYASSHEGWLLKGADGESNLKRWVNVGGRPLGIDFDAQGRLWVANAYDGLQRVDRDGSVVTVLSQIDGSPIVYADDVVVADDGTVYFSDASTKFSAQQWGGTLQASLLDMNEHGRYGRIIEYDPGTRQSRIIMDNLSFANGVALDPQGRFLLVAETGEYRIWKLWLSGDKAGESEVIIDQLPGFPDNVHRGQNGRFWIGLTSPRSVALDRLSGRPFLRKIVQRLPAFMRPNVVHYGMVLAIDENGNVMQNLQAPNGEVYATTGAWESDQYLYVSSLSMPSLPRYSKESLLIQ